MESHALWIQRCPGLGRVSITVVSDDLFPLMLNRCGLCERGKSTVALHWARLHADEWRTEFECVLHAFAAWCAHVDALGTHAERGCYHRTFTAASYESLEPCWCGNVSWLDPSFAERMIAIALGITADGYVFRHACLSCGIAFRTKHPRGAETRCAFCRGKIDEAMANDELYSSAWARRLMPSETVP